MVTPYLLLLSDGSGKKLMTMNAERGEKEAESNCGESICCGLNFVPHPLPCTFIC